MNIFRFSSAFREARELRFSGGGGGEPRGTSPEMNFKKEDLGFKDKLAERQREGEAATETPEQRAEKLVGACNGSLQKHQELLKTFEPAVQDQMKAAMIRFFETTVGNFDRNGVAGLNAQEFEQYQNSAKAKLEEQLKKVQENKDKAKEGVQDSQQRQQQLREQEEKKKMNFAQLKTKLEQQVLEAETVNPLTIQKPGPDATPEQIEEYINTVKTNFAEYQTSVGKLQELQGKLSTQAADIMLLHEKGKDEMKLMSDAMNAGGAAAAAAAGAAVGVWFFGVGALVGAAIGAAIYGIGAAIANEIARKENEAKARVMNEDIKKLKDGFEQVRTSAASAEQQLSANGRELNGAIEPVQANIGVRLARRDQNIAEKDSAIARATEDKNRATGEIQTLRAQLNDPAFINRRDAEAGRIRTQAISKIAELEAGIRQTDQITIPGLQSDKTELEGGRQAEVQIQTNLAAADGEVAEKTLDAELELAQRGGELATAKKQLDTLPPLEPKGFFASLGDGFQGVGDAAKYLLSEGLTPVLDQASTWLKQNIPYAGVALAFPLDVTSGFSKGVGDLVHGLGTMIAHPAQAAEGLSALVGLNPNISAGTAWKEMGRALSGASEFEGGNYGKGAGIVLANLLATATGAGAAGRGLSAARIAYRAARVEHSVLGAAVRSTATATRVTAVAFGQNVAALPGNLASMAGKLLTAPYSLGRGIVSRARTPRVDRLLARQEAATAKVAELNAAIEKLDLPPQLRNMGPEELEALLKNPAELQRLGINNAKTINNVLELRKLVGERAAAEAAASAAAHEAELVADDLGDLPNAARSRDPNALRAVLEQYSTKGRQPQRAYQVVEATPDGGLIAFDAAGELKLVPADEVSGFLKNASDHAKANWNGSRRVGGAERTDYPISVLNNSDRARMVVARRLLGDMQPPFAPTPAQEAAILRAHRATGLRNKAQILDDAGIPRAQRDKLMRHGVTGNPANFPRRTGSIDPQARIRDVQTRLAEIPPNWKSLPDAELRALYERQCAIMDDLPQGKQYRQAELYSHAVHVRPILVELQARSVSSAARLRAQQANLRSRALTFAEQLDNLGAPESAALAKQGKFKEAKLRLREESRTKSLDEDGVEVRDGLLKELDEAATQASKVEEGLTRIAAEAPVPPRAAVEVKGDLPRLNKGQRGTITLKDGTQVEVTFVGESARTGDLTFVDLNGRVIRVKNPRAAPEATPRTRAGNADFANPSALIPEGVGIIRFDGVPVRVSYRGRNAAGEHVFHEILPDGAAGPARQFTRPPEAFGPRAAPAAAPRARAGNADFAAGTNLPREGSVGTLAIDGVPTRVRYNGTNAAGEHVFMEVLPDGALGAGRQFTRPAEAFRPRTAPARPTAALEADPAARVRYSLSDLHDGFIPSGTRLRINIRGERQNLTYQGTTDGVHTFLDEAGNTVTHAHSEFVAVGGPRAPRAPRPAPRPPRAPRAPEPPLGDLNLAELPTITAGGVRGHILSINGNRISYLVRDGGRMRVVTKTLKPEAAAEFQAKVGEKLAAAKVPDRVRVGRNPDGDVFAVRKADGTFGFETVAYRRSGWERVPGSPSARRFSRARQRDAYRRARKEVWNTPFEDSGTTLRQQFGDDLAKIEEGLQARINKLTEDLGRATPEEGAAGTIGEAVGPDVVARSLIETHGRTLTEVRAARALEARLPPPEPRRVPATPADEAAAAAGEGAEASAVTAPGRGRRALNYVLSRPGAAINRLRGRGRPAPAEPAPGTPPPVEGAPTVQSRGVRTRVREWREARAARAVDAKKAAMREYVMQYNQRAQNLVNRPWGKDGSSTLKQAFRGEEEIAKLKPQVEARLAELRRDVGAGVYAGDDLTVAQRGIADCEAALTEIDALLAMERNIASGVLPTTRRSWWPGRGRGPGEPPPPGPTGTPPPPAPPGEGGAVVTPRPGLRTRFREWREARAARRRAAEPAPTEAAASADAAEKAAAAKVVDDLLAEGKPLEAVEAQLAEKADALYKRLETNSTPATEAEYFAARNAAKEARARGARMIVEERLAEGNSLSTVESELAATVESLRGGTTPAAESRFFRYREALAEVHARQVPPRPADANLPAEAARAKAAALDRPFGTGGRTLRERFGDDLGAVEAGLEARIATQRADLAKLREFYDANPASRSRMEKARKRGEPIAYALDETAIRAGISDAETALLEVRGVRELEAIAARRAAGPVPAEPFVPAAAPRAGSRFTREGRAVRRANREAVVRLQPEYNRLLDGLAEHLYLNGPRRQNLFTEAGGDLARYREAARKGPMKTISDYERVARECGADPAVVRSEIIQRWGEIRMRQAETLHNVDLIRRGVHPTVRPDAVAQLRRIRAEEAAGRLSEAAANNMAAAIRRQAEPHSYALMLAEDTKLVLPDMRHYERLLTVEREMERAGASLAA